MPAIFGFGNEEVVHLDGICICTILHAATMHIVQLTSSSLNLLLAGGTRP
jgi:hypothetical protein